MFNNINRKLYFKRLHLLKMYGIAKGLILPFEDEMYQALENVVYAGIPAIMYLKFLQPTLPPGKCEERSYVITMAFKDCFLVRGSHKDLELNHGKKRSTHYWVEHNGWCYDPSLMVKIQQKLYYQMFQLTNVKKYHRSEFEQEDFYQQCINGHIGRFSLSMTAPLIEAIALMSNNQGFINEAKKFKTANSYNPITILK